MKNWPLIAGLILAVAGIAMTWLDIGSPSTGSTLLWAGILVLLWRLLRFRGG